MLLMHLMPIVDESVPPDRVTCSSCFRCSGYNDLMPMSDNAPHYFNPPSDPPTQHFIGCGRKYHQICAKLNAVLCYLISSLLTFATIAMFLDQTAKPQRGNQSPVLDVVDIVSGELQRTLGSRPRHAARDR